MKLFILLHIYLVISIAASYAQNNSVDVQHYKFELQLNDTNNVIHGNADIIFKMTKPANDCYYDLREYVDSTGKGMKVAHVSSDSKQLKFSQEEDHLIIYFENTLAANTNENISIEYSGIPTDGLIIDTNKFAHRTFFGDNWPNRAHNWIPCNDHPSDKASVEFIVTAPDHYRVIANGVLANEKLLSNNQKVTHWKEDVDLPTKVMVIGVADFAVDTSANVNGIPVTSWVFPENKESGFSQYAVAAKILPFFNGYIAPYPFKKLANVQSKTKFGGMENAGNIFYYQNSVKQDSFTHKDYIRLEGLFAHEEAHQWFGDEASETGWQHVWLSEGFATYMTHLYFEHTYGEDTLQSRMRADRKKIIDFYRKRKTPIVDTTSMSDPLVLLNVNSYQKGGWVLHMLRRKSGDSLFHKGIQAYYKKYQGKNASTKDFIKTMEEISKQHLDLFAKQWLYTAGHPVLQLKWDYDQSRKLVTMKINQMQSHLFIFPLEIALVLNGKTIMEQINVNNRIETLTFPAAVKPQAIQLDPKVNLLFENLSSEQ